MDMARKKHRAEEIIPKLRAMEVHIAKGLKADEAARKEGITEQTYYLLASRIRWVESRSGQASERFGEGERSSQEAVGRGSS